MSGIYQLNQATGSVTLPSSGNTFIGTSTNSELYSVDSSGTVTIYGTGSGGGGGSTIDTGSFATTGSNSFYGNQIITGSLTIHSSGTASPALNFENDGTSTPLAQIKGQSYGGGSGGGIDFYYYNGSHIEGFQLNNTGNVGIGTSSPPQRLTVSGSISASGTVVSSGVNIDTTDTSSSFDMGTGEQIIPVWSGMNVSSSGIISQAFPSGRIGRTTEILGDATFDLGGGVYPVDGHHVMYHSGSRELWRATGEWDLSAFGMPRSVGHLLKYGDGNTAGNAFTFNDYELVVGENISEVWGGAFLMGRQSGSTYGANTQYAGFFVSASLGLPGTPQGHDKAFTIYTGNQTGPAFNIYTDNDPDNAHNSDPIFSVSSSGEVILNNLPTTEPIGPTAVTGSLWISGSGGGGATNSGYLMVFNP